MPVTGQVRCDGRARPDEDRPRIGLVEAGLTTGTAARPEVHMQDEALHDEVLGAVTVEVGGRQLLGAQFRGAGDS